MGHLMLSGGKKQLKKRKRNNKDVDNATQSCTAVAPCPKRMAVKERRNKGMMGQRPLHHAFGTLTLEICSYGPNGKEVRNRDKYSVYVRRIIFDSTVHSLDLLPLEQVMGIAHHHSVASPL